MTFLQMGWMNEFPMILSFGLGIFSALCLGFTGARLYVWTIVAAAFAWSLALPTTLCLLVGIPLAIMNVPLVRQLVFSGPILKLLRAMNFLPVISETERIALEAGSTWVDGELFSGKPNFKKILAEPYRKLSLEEQKFVNGPVETVCKMITDWDVQKNKDLPKHVWDYLKKERFFGMIVPKEYGGHGFSAIAHSEVVQKLSSRSVTLGITVMVPNSLGPAELINHYGTQKQKDYYLPRLARGEEIPCFALTEPNAGSDAGSMVSEGEVFKGNDGKLYVRLNWDKRYITLAAVSTIIGLAVRLRDNDNLLGKGNKDIGITCVLVPAKTPGVVLGKRHNPMGIAFYNCPTKGENVVVSVDQIIGGVEGAGKGWKMLMECLAAGRSVSLPAQSTSLAKVVTRVTSAYALVRRQFGVSIGKFEGVEEKMARMVGLTYMMEASRTFTCGAVDNGIKPAVVSAIAKYNSTEIGRILVNDGMDVLGGAGISRGPRNTLATAYIAAPIGITVEGANILTRTMIIFGQGAIRCHPFAYKELQAIMGNNVRDFDRAFWGHIGFIVRNTCRALVLSLTRGRLAGTPGGPAKRHYQKLAWSSASFAILADVAMGLFGGQLKFKEKMTGRFADVLIWMYFATATLRRYEAEGHRPEHRAILEWSMQYCFAQIQKAFDGLYANFDVPVIGALLKWPVAFWSRLNRISDDPSDQLGHSIVSKIMQPGEYRDSLTSGIFFATDRSDAHSVVEHAFKLAADAEPILAKIMKAVKQKKLPKGRTPTRLIEKAFEEKVISEVEARILRDFEQARQEAIKVDAFDLAEFETGHIEARRSAVG